MKHFNILLSYFLVICLFLMQSSYSSNTGGRIDYIKTMGFRCIGQTKLDTGIRVNSENDIECLSLNGRECIFGLNTDAKCIEMTNDKNKHKIIPLQCGAKHKAIYGNNGYDNPGHWCHKGLEYFFGGFGCPEKTGMKIAISLNKGSGEIQCMSKDFVNCYNGKDTNAVCRNTNRCRKKKNGRLFIQAKFFSPSPVVGEVGCGESMRQKIGHTGYEIPGDHWCKKALSYYRYTGEWLVKSQTGLNEIVRLGEKGDIECISLHSGKCLNVSQGDAKQRSVVDELTKGGTKKPKTVICGKNLPKGKTGFEDKKSWCSKALGALVGGNPPPSTEPKKKDAKKDAKKDSKKDDKKDGKKDGKKDRKKDAKKDAKKDGKKDSEKDSKKDGKKDGKKDDKKKKKDDKNDFHWRDSEFGPKKSGLQPKKASRKNGDKKADPKKDGKKPEKKTVDPGWRNDGPIKVDISPDKNVLENGIGKTWRSGPYTKPDILAELAKHKPPKKPEPKDTWRHTDQMYHKDKKSKKQLEKEKKKKEQEAAKNKRHPPKKAVQKGYDKKWQPFMEKLQFYSKKGQPVLYGSIVKIGHITTKGVLRSEPKNYNTGSHQQEISCGKVRTDNDWWVIGSPNGKKKGPVKHGEVIILTHKTTGKNLHSHHLFSPTSHQQEVSGYGDNGKGDSNDNFRLLITGHYIHGENEWKTGDIIRFLHANTGAFLHSHNLKTKVTKQQEVTGFKGDDMNNDWSVVELFAKK